MKQICSLGENKLLGNFADKLLLNGGVFHIIYQIHSLLSVFVIGYTR